MGFDANIAEEKLTTGTVDLPSLKEAVVKLRVEGMTCQSCVTNIEGKIRKLHGVAKIKVSLDNQEAIIAYHPYIIQPDDLKGHISDLGYECTIKSKSAPLKLGALDLQHLITLSALQQAIESLPPGNFKVSLLNDSEANKAACPSGAFTYNVVRQTPQSTAHVAVIKIDGMTCNSCVQSIEGAVSQRQGVQHVAVSLAGSTGTIHYDPAVTSGEELRAAIEDMGFDASVLTGNSIFSSVGSLPSSSRTPQNRLPPMSTGCCK
uniref:HMA domain-containing protein n=1 Tax=Zosterops lateralis melanops TaxID=1220523 RepID=A0A8D2PJX4_ZOSLA